MIYVIGIGPGCRDLMTQEAISAMEDAEVIVGYKTYIKLVEDFVKDKEVVQNGMRKEVDRCQDAIDIPRLIWLKQLYQDDHRAKHGKHNAERPV